MQVIEEAIEVLSDYGRIPISFEVRTIFDVRPVSDGLGGLTLVERSVEAPWIKDYDAIRGEGPTRWAKRWDLSNWGIISAYLDDERVGGCVIAHDTPESYMLEDRKDVAALWDLRVHPNHRRMGIGSRLLEAATEWVSGRACRLMKIETQNINVPACRFYAAHGFTLGSVNRFAYPELPDETELIWIKLLLHLEDEMAGGKSGTNKTLQAMRDFAMRYPEADEGTSCNKIAIRARKKAYLYLGSKDDSWNVMLKVVGSMHKAEKLAKKEPEHYSVGKHGWITSRFGHDESPPKGLFEGWIDESYRAIVPKSLVATLPESGPPAGSGK